MDNPRLHPRHWRKFSGDSPMERRRKQTAANFINVDRRVGPDEMQQRFAERDARLAADTRTEAEKFLGDPPPDRSALARGSPQAPRRSSSAGQRVDLWRRCDLIKKIDRIVRLMRAMSQGWADEKDIDLGLPAARLAAIIGSNLAVL